MSVQDYTTTLLVDQTPAAVFEAITNVRGWWSEELEGESAKEDDVFNYHFEDIHRCKVRITEAVPGEKVSWLVLANHFKPGIFGAATTDHSSHPAFTHGEDEWNGTRMSFEISEKGNKTQLTFTHHGLVPTFECYDACCGGWNHYIRVSLLGLITTGKGQPNSAGNAKTSHEEKIQAGVAKG